MPNRSRKHPRDVNELAAAIGDRPRSFGERRWEGPGGGLARSARGVEGRSGSRREAIRPPTAGDRPKGQMGQKEGDGPGRRHLDGGVP